MINANVQQQQQVDNKKATNANYNRRTQINLAQYSSTRNTLSDNYYIHKDYQLIESTVDSTSTTSATNDLCDTADSPTSATTISLPSDLLLASADSTVTANLINDQISALFPKCRPKNDANLNKTSLYIETSGNASSLASAATLLAPSPSSSDYTNQNRLIDHDNLLSIGQAITDTIVSNQTYSKMNAQNSADLMGGGGGTANGSASLNGTAANSNIDLNTRINMSSYQLRNGNGHQRGGNYQPSHADNSDYHHSERFVWEKRRRSPNTTPASTVLNSPDLSDVSHYGHHPVQHQIKVGRSPVNQHEYGSRKSSTSPPPPPPPSSTSHHRSSARPMALVSDGEVVVFDDIGENGATRAAYDNIRQHMSTFDSIGRQSSHPKQQQQQQKPHYHRMLFDDDTEVGQRDHDTNPFTSENMTKMIGILPIAEYDGSPRRFGNYQQDQPAPAPPPPEQRPPPPPPHRASYLNQQQYDRPPSSRKVLTSPTLFPPRPGFPQRITSSPSPTQPLPPPFQRHLNNSASNTPSPAPPQQPLQQQSSSSFDAQNAMNNSSPSSSHVVPLTTSNLIASSSALDLNVGASPANGAAASATATPSSGVKATTTPSSYSNLLGNSTSSYLTTSSTTNANRSPLTTAANTTTFDYLYEFSETRKVLEDFFKCPNTDEDKKITDCFNESDTGSFDNLNEIDDSKKSENNYVGQRLAKLPSSAANNKDYSSTYHSPRTRYTANNYINHQQLADEYDNNDVELYLDSNSRSSGELADTELETNQRRYSRHFTLSPETTDYDSNCGDLDSLSNEINGCGVGLSSTGGMIAGLSSTGQIIPDFARLYTSMPVLEDGLSSGHASDTENNNRDLMVCRNRVDSPNRMRPTVPSNIFESNSNVSPAPINASPIKNSIMTNAVNSNIDLVDVLNTCDTNNDADIAAIVASTKIDLVKKADTFGIGIGILGMQSQPQSMQPQQTMQQVHQKEDNRVDSKSYLDSDITSIFSNGEHSVDHASGRFDQRDLYSIPAPLSPITSVHNNKNLAFHDEQKDVMHAALKDIRTTLQQSKSLSMSQPLSQAQPPPPPPPTQPTSSSNRDDEANHMKNDRNATNSPVWLPRHHHNPHSQSRESLNSDNPSKPLSIDDDEADTDLETDRLLGQQRLDDHGFYDEKTLNWCDRSSRLIKSPSTSMTASKSQQHHSQTFSSASIRQGIGTASTGAAAAVAGATDSNATSSPPTMSAQHMDSMYEKKSPYFSSGATAEQNDATDNSCLTSPNKLIMPAAQKSPSESLSSKTDTDGKKCGGKARNKEGHYWEPAVLIEGVLFRARYLGSTQLVCEGQPNKSTRMMQAEEAVSRIKAPEGETQPSTEVDLFISTEKIMVLNTDLKEIMMDHALRTISYIADIGDLVVLMARRRFVPSDTDEAPKINRTPKMICHVFESDEAQFIAQSIGQAFQVAYMEFLKANGIEDHSFVKEMDYQEVLNSQEIFGDELEIFAKKELQKEVVVPKSKGEILGMVIVESGWGSMLPTVVIANLLSTGAAARCGQLNIGDQIIAINGLSLVGLPLSTCQSYIRNTKTQTAVKFTVVPCPPVVEVKIKRPNTKYQLGFSVQNGVICSLLRGGIAERGGVRVGHRIIEINNQSVVAVPHEKIVNLLATSVGEILMKTMPTSMFRLLTGQENPVYI